MLGRLFKKRNDNKTIVRSMYDRLVSQAREPEFYRDLGVPDSLDGRFNMIVLHYFIAYSALKDRGEAGRALFQDVFDLFRVDMDRSLRELGVGDTTVPKKMKKMMQVFYGRLDAFSAALGAADQEFAMAKAIERNILDYNSALFDIEADGKGQSDDGAQAAEFAKSLSKYVLECCLRLEKVTDTDILSGRLSFAEIRVG